MWIILWAVLMLVMTTAEVNGQVSISSLRSTAESSNLQVVTLQGVVQLTRPRRQELGGKCGAHTFTLTDDSGSIEVAIRRANRMVEPLRDGDRVQMTAQVKVFRGQDNIPLRICVEAIKIQHLAP
ncbi:MAG: OB-fold nucleic acid binding domain-containing protein [Nitrospirota bacterium]